MLGFRGKQMELLLFKVAQCMTIPVILDRRVYGQLFDPCQIIHPFRTSSNKLYGNDVTCVQISCCDKVSCLRVLCILPSRRTTNALKVIPPQCRAWQCSRSSRGNLYKCRHQHISAINKQEWRISFSASLFSHQLLSLLRLPTPAWMYLLWYLPTRGRVQRIMDIAMPSFAATLRRGVATRYVPYCCLSNKIRWCSLIIHIGRCSWQLMCQKLRQRSRRWIWSNWFIHVPLHWP